MSSSEDFVTKSPEKTPTHKTKRDPLKWLEDKEKEDKDKYREKDRYKEKDRYTTESRYTDKRKEDDRLRTEEREKATKADLDKLAKEKSAKEEENKKKLQEAEKLAKELADEIAKAKLEKEEADRKAEEEAKKTKPVKLGIEKSDKELADEIEKDKLPQEEVERLAKEERKANRKKQREERAAADARELELATDTEKAAIERRQVKNLIIIRALIILLPWLRKVKLEFRYVR